MHQELKVLALSMEARLDNLLDFPFWFAIDNLWWQSFVIGPMGFGFAISGQEIHMKYGVDLHRQRKSQAIGYGG